MRKEIRDRLWKAISELNEIQDDMTEEEFAEVGEETGHVLMHATWAIKEL